MAIDQTQLSKSMSKNICCDLSGYWQVCDDHEVKNSKESKVKNPQKISKLGVGGTVKISGMLN